MMIGLLHKITHAFENLSIVQFLMINHNRFYDLWSDRCWTTFISPPFPFFAWFDIFKWIDLCLRLLFLVNYKAINHQATTIWSKWHSFVRKLEFIIKNSSITWIFYDLSIIVFLLSTPTHDIRYGSIFHEPDS